MASNDLKWVRVRATGSGSRSMREFSLRSAASTNLSDSDGVELELPDLGEYATPLAKARFLLDTAAEIEQALMLEYLYAAYSLKDSSDSSLTVEQRNAINEWRRLVVDTAVDEMGHLMTVQNLLLFLGQPPNLEREDFPPRKNLYPFAMNLEPLTQKSLAKYVVAESPSDATGIEDIVSQAMGANGTAINRVGILYAILGVVFTRQDQLESNASSGDPWSICVRDMGLMLYKEFTEIPKEEWHLLDSHFDPSSINRQADASWQGGASMRVDTVSNRTQCLDALKFISVQGEGLSTKSTASGLSHFERFLSIYRGNGMLPFPPSGDWLPTRLVATNPFVDLNSTDPNAIVEPIASEWATLANHRYALLLALLQQFFTDDLSRRDAIRDWCFSGGMTALRLLSRKLVTLDRRSGTSDKASVPFTLPGVINLPNDQESRIALIGRRIARANLVIGKLRAGGATDSVLNLIETADRDLLSAFGISLPQGNTAPPSGPTTPGGPSKGPDAKRPMIELLKSKKVRAQVMHGAIHTPGGESLSDLFRAERYEDILAFLQSSSSVVDPFTGKPLITKGQPTESAFYLHISDADGVMAGRFSPDEIAIVGNWITSLTEVAATKSTNQPFRCKSRLVASGFRSPVCLVAAPDDEGRLFVIEQGGLIKIVRTSDGEIADKPFLQLNDISSGGEQGLLGLAFHPDFANNGMLFVNCTNLLGATEIRSYRTKATAPDEADPSSMKVLLTVPQPFRNHNGGWIAFCPRDGFLYIGMGDGGSANDPQNNGQNLNSLLGKILRIDVNADDFPSDSSRNYAIPPSNPFGSIANARPEIWAFGLRNPWRCAFDRQTGDMYMGDVGQNKREEINFQSNSSGGGENYGWRIKEGSLETGLGSTTGITLVDPIHEYGPTDGFAVIGGYVYRGKQFPVMDGTYFFGDHGGRIWSLIKNAKRDVIERTPELRLDEEHSLENLSTFGEDANGEIYFATLSGDLFQITAESSKLDDGRWKDTAKIRIHPAIGVARVGNAGFVNNTPVTPAPQENFFVGPERPFETSPPMGGYKRNGRIRRQAARFRLFAYDSNDKLIGEITSDVADIAWTAELANKKASFRRFTGLSTTTQLRNSSVSGSDRSKLEITPGPRTLTGPNQSAAFDGGSFTDWEAGQPRPVNNIYLGEMQSEDSGSLLILGGEGTAKTPWNRTIQSFVNNDGWFDTIADGPVTAKVQFKTGGAPIEAVPSWVICAPPKFAPALRNVVTLRDVLFNKAVESGWLKIPAKPSFRYDIYPILHRAISLQWLLAAAGSNHDVIADSFPPTPSMDPADVFRRLRSPHAGENGPGQNMPQLFDDENEWLRNGDKGLTFTPSMYEMLRRWSIGEYIDDWTGQPPEPSAEITPEGLDFAALENCSGGGFYPGIEAGWMMRDTLQYIQPFRLDPTTLSAGDISRQMAVPWQADFYKCTTTPGDGGRRVGWWPQQRPDDVFVEGNSVRQAWIRDKIQSHKDMVDKWHELGFVVSNGSRFVETERNPNS